MDPDDLDDLTDVIVAAHEAGDEDTAEWLSDVADDPALVEMVLSPAREADEAELPAAPEPHEPLSGEE